MKATQSCYRLCTNIYLTKDFLKPLPWFDLNSLSGIRLRTDTKGRSLYPPPQLKKDLEHATNPLHVYDMQGMLSVPALLNKCTSHQGSVDMSLLNEMSLYSNVMCIHCKKARSYQVYLSNFKSNVSHYTTRKKWNKYKLAC